MPSFKTLPLGVSTDCRFFGRGAAPRRAMLLDDEVHQGEVCRATSCHGLMRCGMVCAVVSW